jgi:eukaryotic-like serine/threonine-protein kinase
LPRRRIIARTPVALTPGTRLGPYEVIAPIGEGGMGQVYRARDTKLNRDVALKVLPDSFANDPDRLARFQREAQVLASLNHPNIAHIHGLEDSGGVRALVMELVEGEDLAQRLTRGAIPVDEALPIARQIAEALEAAHEQGIIHRDLKPANIKVRPDGTVKVLDFGLAKALDPLASLPDMSQSPTITTPAMTRAGMILGTAAYMSPEQAKGRAVDKRSDLWAFGCVLFEMLTGHRTFGGENVSDTLAHVLMKDPDWTALPPDTPAPILRLLRRCLEKDRKRRLADIADARAEIDDASAEPATIGPPAAMGRRARSAAAVAVILVAMLVGVALTILVERVRTPEQSSRAGSVMRLDLNLPPGVELYTGAAQTAAVSPDGTRVAFIGVRGGVRQIFVRRLDHFEATPLSGTETSNACFFSPDGRSLGFEVASGGGLKKVSIADGLVVPLASDVDFTTGGAWGPDDRITFARTGGLWQIPAAGGAATQVTHLNKGTAELSHQWPTVVADGKVILFTVVTGSGRGAAHIEALTLATGQRQIVVDPGTFSLYAPSGHLIFYRDDAMLAAAFDVNRGVVTGPPIRVLDGLVLDNTGAPLAALSTTGALVYPTGGQATSQMIWVSRQGLEQPMSDTPRPYTNPRLAPDGKRVVVTALGDLWIQDTARPTFTRLTSNETAGNSYAVWTPDGNRVVFRTRTGLHWIDADGSGRLHAIPGTSVVDYPNSVSPDGATLAFIRITEGMSADIYVLSLQGEPHPHAILQGPAYEGGPQFSPDGRWLAYASDESGQFQVYVRPFAGPDRRWPVSTQGGTQPRWNRKGKELFYRNGNKMMVVDVVSTGPELVLSSPRLIFEQRYAFAGSVTTPNYDVSPDGQQFVMVKDESGSGRLSVVLNWSEELKRLVPTK